jgi:hydrogenase-4 membrane subunit HyfE
MLLVCSGRLRTESRKFLVYGVLLLIAGALLISVVITGFLLPNKVATKLHNLVFTAHNSMLATAYVATGVAQIISNKRNAACISLGM